MLQNDTMNYIRVGRMNLRSLLLSALIALAVVGVISARTVPADISELSSPLSTSFGDGTFKPIENILVSPSSDSINQTSPYVVEFDLRCSEFVQLNYGGFGIAFPEGFGIEPIERAAVSDDSQVVSFRVSRIEKSGQTVYLHLRHVWKDGGEDHYGDWCNNTTVHVRIGLCDVENPPDAGSYQLALVAFDKKNRIIAGPNLSQPFAIADTAQPLPPEIKIWELTSLAPNAPWVNTSQPFQMRCRVANVSDQDLDKVTLMLTSNGESQILQSLVEFPIPAGDTADTYFDIMADSFPNVGEQFLAEVIYPAPAVYSQLDKIENVIIQVPTSLTLTHEVFGVANGVAPINGTFSMAVELAVEGQSSVTDAEYEVTVEPAVIDPYPVYGTISAGKHIIFEFHSPPENSRVVVSFRLVSPPVDLNTGLPTPLDTNEFSFEVFFESTSGEILARSEPIGNNLIVPERFRDVFSLNLTNLAATSRLAVVLDSVVVEFFDAELKPLDVSGNIDLTSSGFKNIPGYENCRTNENRLVCSFSDLQIPAGDSVTLNFGLRWKRKDLKSFVVRLDLSRVGLSYAFAVSSDPRPMLVTDDGYVHDFNMVVRGESLGESLVIERNPVNPDEEPLRFSYILNVDSDVEFRIFTLTGEEVYARDIRSGSQGAVAGGENVIEWDGRNNEGNMVLNGVYLTHVRIVATGESTTEKVAVLK